MSEVAKLKKDGKTAVLYSPQYGAGWSTWNTNIAVALTFDAEIAQAVLDGDNSKAIAIAERKFPDGYFGGGRDLKVEWIPEGEAFEISEYDGFESIRLMGQQTFMTA